MSRANLLDPFPTNDDWQSLTVVPDKRRAFASDLHFRESWGDCIQVLGSTKLLGTLALLSFKPDAVIGRRMGPAIEFIKRAGFTPVAVAPIVYTRHSMRELWRHNWDNYTVDRLALMTWMHTSTESLLVLYFEEREGNIPASVRLSNLKGAGNPTHLGLDSLRGFLKPPCKVINFVHVADEPADVVRELGIFLDQPERIEILKQIASRKSVYEEVCKRIHALEMHYPAHDLSVQTSLRRLVHSGVATSAIDRIRTVILRGERLCWSTLCDLVDPNRPYVNRWDFICVATRVLELEREPRSRMFPNVTSSDWIASTSPQCLSKSSDWYYLTSLSV